MKKSSKIVSGKPAKPGFIRVSTNLPENHKGPVVGQIAQVTIGDEVLPVTSAIIRIKPGNLITVELETYAEFVDIEAMQKATEIKIVELEK
jgi:hypothetical protein